MPLAARLMVWLEAKVPPLAAATVTVELSPSSISVGCAETVHVASSLSEMVTVAEPMDCPPWDAVTVTVSVALNDGVVGGGDGGRGRACARPELRCREAVVGAGRRAADGEADGLVGGEGLAVGNGHGDGGTLALVNLRGLSRNRPRGDVVVRYRDLRGGLVPRV